MNVTDYIILAVVALILGGAGYAIYNARKNGRKCIGCPDSASCPGNCPGCNCKKTDQRN